MDPVPPCPRCGAERIRAGETPVCGACAFGELAAGAGPARDRIAAPRRFGDFEVLGEVARGGMGVVLRAVQRSLDREVAIKVLPAVHSGAAVARFQTEILAAARLHHPHIIAVHGSGEVDGQPFYVMEYVDGRSLDAWSGGRPADPREAARLARQVALAVAHAHRCGVIHRDLKPANVLVDRDGAARVADFGLAKRMDEAVDLTLTGELLGSPGFVAPEQLEGRRRTGPHCDIYGIGAILYHLLTGRAPFEGSTLAATLQQVLRGDPRPPGALVPKVPAELDAVVCRCLARNPDRRYPTAGAVAEELERFLAGRPVHARPRGALGRAWHRCRRRPRTSLALASMIAAVAAAGAWSVADRARAERAASAARAGAGEDRYATEVLRASRLLQAGRRDDAGAVLDSLRPTPGSPDPRGWEWHWLRAASNGGQLEVVARLRDPVRDQARNPASGVRALLTAGSLHLVGGPDGAPPRTVPLGAAAGATRIAASPLGGRIALAGPFGAAIWEPGTPQPRLLTSEAASDVAWAPDGSALAVLGTPETGGAVTHRTVPDGLPVRLDAEGALAVAWSGHDRAWVLADRRGGVRIWDPRRPFAETRVSPGSPVQAAAVSSDGLHAAIVEVSGILRAYDVRTGLTVAEGPFPAPQSSLLAVSGSIVAAAGDADPDIRAWRLPDLTPLGLLAGHSGGITSLRLPAPGGLLESSSADGTVRSWRPARNGFVPGTRGDGDSGAGPAAVFSPAGNQIAALVRRGPGPGMATVLGLPALESGGAIGSWWPLAWIPGPADRLLAWRESGELLTASGSPDGLGITHHPGVSLPGIRARAGNRGEIVGVLDRSARLHLVGSQSGRPAADPREGVRWFEMDPESDALAFATPEGSFALSVGDGTLQPLGTGRITAAAWIPRTGDLVAGDESGEITVWPRGRPGPARRWRAHAGAVRALGIAHDGRLIASAGPDPLVHLWRADSGRELAAVPRPGPVDALVFSPDGSFLAVAEKGYVEMLGIRPPDPPAAP